MLPLRCFSLLLLTVVIAANDDDATDTLIEMEVSTLKGEEAAATEMLAEDETTTMKEPAPDDENELRDLNKDFDRLGKIYVAQYYTLFDDPSRRLSLVALYHFDDSFLSYEGQRYRGTKKILAKYEQLNLVNIERSIISVDSQPLHDGGIIINVVGKVKANSEPSRLYTQTFIFKPQKGSFFLQHDIFRVIRESMAMQ